MPGANSSTTKPYRCEVCDANGKSHRGFTRQYALNRHMNTAHGGKDGAKRFHCAWLIERDGQRVECGFAATQKQNLDEHVEKDQ